MNVIGLIIHPLPIINLIFTKPSPALARINANSLDWLVGNYVIFMF